MEVVVVLVLARSVTDGDEPVELLSGRVLVHLRLQLLVVRLHHLGEGRDLVEQSLCDVVVAERSVIGRHGWKRKREEREKRARQRSRELKLETLALFAPSPLLTTATTGRCV